MYREYSNKLYNLLLEYTDIIERFSIDECFLDMTGFLMGRTLEDVAKEINNRVRNELKFTVNIGIAHNKLLAKMASDFEKPDKIHTLYENEIEKKMWTLPASELFMLGRKTVPKLLNMQIKTIGDVAKTDKEILVRKFGKHGQMMWEYANGIDNSPVNNVKELPKSIGNSVTLARDLKSIDEINPILVALVEKVTYRLRKYQMLADVINVQLRTNNFIDYSHQKKLAYSTSSTKDILKLAKEGLQITLALSLHAATDEKRQKLMPVANKYTIAELLDACRYFFKATGRRVTFEYSLVAGVNDMESEAVKLGNLLKDINCHVNLIPVNPIKERNFKQSVKKDVEKFKNVLEKYKINVTIRREMGRDIQGACGQLRKSYKDNIEGNGKNATEKHNKKEVEW